MINVAAIRDELSQQLHIYKLTNVLECFEQWYIHTKVCHGADHTASRFRSRTFFLYLPCSHKHKIEISFN